MAGSGEQFVPMYFVFIAMLMGAISLTLVEKFSCGAWGKVPYVLVIFLEGIGMGLLTNNLQDELGDFSDSFLIWQSIDPFLLLAVFLPGLLFGDGMETVMYRLQKIIPQLVLLCLVGVAINTVLIAVSAHYFLQAEQWGFYACLLFGTILSSPDPVVLINLLESTSDAPEEYKLLAGSESHFCDLTTFTLFTVFFSIVTLGVEEEFGDGLETVRFLSFNILGGPITGILAGIVAVYGIRTSKGAGRESNVLVQITITVFTAYLAFLISEHGLRGNGILATVCASLVIAGYAKPSFVSIHTVEVVWKTIEYFAVTIVIFLSGVIVAEVLFQSTIDNYAELLIDCIVVYFTIMISRLIMLGTLFVPLNKVGTLSVKEALSMGFANVRGALTLTLALAVFRIDEVKYEKNLNKNFFDSGIDSKANVTRRLLAGEEDDGLENPILRRQLARFYLIIAFVTLATIVINYTLSSKVFRLLKLQKWVKHQNTDPASVRGYINQRIAKKYREVMHKAATKLHAENRDGLIDSSFLSEKLTYFSKTDYDEHKDQEIDQYGSSKYVAAMSREDLENDVITLEDLKSKSSMNELAKMQTLFYTSLKKSYWGQIERGVIPKGSSTALQLLYSAEVGLDEGVINRSDFDALQLPKIDTVNKKVQMYPTAKYLNAFADLITCGYFNFLEKHQLSVLRGAVYAASCYIDAHKDAEIKIAETMGAGAEIDTYEEAMVIKQSIILTKEARQYIEDCKTIDEDVEKVIETIKVGAAMIEGHQTYMLQLKEEGLVEENDVTKEFDVLAGQKAFIRNRGFFQKKLRENIKKKDTMVVDQAYLTRKIGSRTERVKSDTAEVDPAKETEEKMDEP